MTEFIIGVWLILVPASAIWRHPDIGSGKAQRSNEQLHFSAEEDRVEAPIPIPQVVVTALEEDDFVRSALENEEAPPEKFPLSWFSASAIHLRNSRKVDLVIMAVKPIRGANVTMFWLFRAYASGYQLVLRTGTHDLEFKNTRHRGYRDVECSAVVMQKLSRTSYRFDGTQYLRYEGKLSEVQ